jgi:hypothetical protein
MYNPTNPGYSTQNQTRITPNYEPTISDNPYASSPYDLQKVPTPPKPPHVKNKIIFALGVVIVVLLVVISGLVFGLVYVNNKIAGNIPTPGPTVVATTSILSTPIQTALRVVDSISHCVLQQLVYSQPRFKHPQNKHKVVVDIQQ